MKYKKSLLSVAASIAISSTMLTANYLPLTTTTSDNQWVLFGVAGYQASGASTAVAGEFSIDGDSAAEILANVITDSNTDGLGQYVAGLRATNVAKDLAYLDVIISSPIEIRVDTTGVDYLESDAFRTMYIDSSDDSASAPTFAFTYKASLENHVLEYSVNGGQTYQVTISSANTFNNPQVGTLTTGGTNNTGIPLINLLNDDTEKNTVVDYNFKNNPPISSSYSANLVTDATTPGNRDVIGNTGATLRMYTYDAVNKKWDIFDAGNTATSNDFTTITAGKAYWGKLDNDGDVTAANTTGEGGLVLGNPSLTTADYTNAKLADGWNLIAFDGVNSEIRHATTGLLVTLAADANLTITDSSGVQAVPVNLVGLTTKNARARAINVALESARLNGSVPYTFDFRAFPAEAADQLALVSNKRFSVSDTDSGAAGTSVTTLTGAKPLLTDSKFAQSTEAVTELNTTRISSAYGEYAMVVKPLISGAARVAGVSTIEIKKNTDTAAVRVDIQSAVAATATEINSETTNITATAIDIDLNATAAALSDHILIASTEPFAIRENTFTRVYLVDKTDKTSNGTIVISGVGSNPTSSSITLTEQQTASQHATAINTAAVTDVKASGDANEYLYIMTNKEAASKFQVAETTLGVDLLTISSVTTDDAQGAIDDIYSLSYLAKKSLTGSIEINASEIPNAPEDNITFTFITAFGDFNVTKFAPNPTQALDYLGNTDADNKSYLDLLVTNITNYFSTVNISATVDHNYTEGTSNGIDASAELNTTVITISGSEIIDANFTRENSIDTNETFIVTFNAGTEIGSDTNITFDGNVTELDEGNTTAIHIAAAVTAGYNSNGGRNWTAIDEGDGSVTFINVNAGDRSDAEDSNFTIEDNATANDTTAITVASVITTLDGSSTTIAETATGSGVLDIGYFGTISADLTTDLKYNNIFTPDYVMDGPLYTMRENSAVLKALVTGSTKMSDGTVAWDSIDLTRKPSEWFNSQDYSLFDTDAQAGYWAYLSLSEFSANTLALEYATLSNEYAYHFDGPTTYNHFSGNLSVKVSNLNDYDSYTSARVTATFGGETVELTQSTTDKSLFTGAISYYEALMITQNNPYDIIINVADGLGNKYTKTVTDQFDNVKPLSPDANITDGIINVDANASETANDIAGFYVFSIGIPEVNPETSTNKVGSITGSSGSIPIECAKISDVTAYDAGAGLKVIAVDGTGVLGGGNASDSTELAFMTIQKNRVVVTDTSAGDVTATTGGFSYDVDCTKSATEITQDTGVTIASITDNKTTKLAYTNLGTDATTALPITVYVSNGGSGADEVVSRITYPVTYVGKDVFVQIVNTSGVAEVFGYELPARATVDAGGTGSGITDTNAVNLSTITNSNNPKTGISF